MAMILSIIVPVFNVRQYLGRCVDSLLNQDIDKDKYEIILVDDGSTDGCGELCDAFAIQEKNIKVLHQENQGLSVARNSGLEIALGAFIQFVDSDDFLQPNVLSFLVETMENGRLDILRFGFRRVYEGENNSIEERACSQLQIERVWEGKEFLLKKLWFTCYACQFIIRRAILETNHLRFKPGIIFEDTEWTPRVLAVSQRVSNTDLVVYNYLIREGSITNSSVEYKVLGQLVLIDELKSQMDLFEDTRWHRGMISHIVVSIISTVSKSLFHQRKKYLRLLLEKRIYPLSSYLASDSGLRKIRIINFSPLLACYLIHIFNK